MTMGEVKIEVTALKLLSGDSPLKAIADIRLGDWEIYNWRIVQQNSNRAQVFTPQTAWVGPGGHLRYRALLSIPGALRQRIEVAILSAWEEEKNHGKTVSHN